MCAAPTNDDTKHPPLYLPRYLNKQKPLNIEVPTEHLDIIQEWQQLLGDPKANKQSIGERKLEGKLTGAFFEQLLGWKSPPNKTPTLNSQLSITGESRTPDIAMGIFSQGSNEAIILGEYKAPKSNLDSKQGEGYQYRTPVEQARNYASLVPSCQFYLVTNMIEWRLYAKNGDPNRYEKWKLDELHEPDNYWRFTALLSESSVLGGSTQRWLQESNQQDKQITKELYGQYQRIRWQVITGLAEANPQITAIELIELAQILLDRVLFIAFAEDNGLLPKNIFKESISASRLRSSWQNLKDLFNSIDKGSHDNSIHAYNGGLFADNIKFDALNIPNTLVESFLPLTEYDFGNEVRVTVLGHIFEQSITELEQLREAAEESPQAFVSDLAKKIAPSINTGRNISGKRKEDGIVYTPDTITRFIAQHTLGNYLDERQAVIREKHQAKSGEWKIPKATKSETLKRAEARKRPTGLDDSQFAQWLYWNEWLLTLQTIKIVDPSCGSGAFLVAAFDVIARYYAEAEYQIRELDVTMTGFDGDRAILTQNLYGVDINAGAVEIAKLSLWLKTAKRGRKLDSLDHQIVCGNSLRFESDQKSLFSSDQFGWEEEFKNIIDSGGFDVVLGNPPYVRQELIKPYKDMLEDQYDVFNSSADLYTYFYELGLRILKTGGRLGYISSSTFFKTSSGASLRDYLLKYGQLNTIVDFGDFQIFEGVTTYPAIITLTKGESVESHNLRFLSIKSDEQLLSLESSFAQSSAVMPQKQLTIKSWSLESEQISALRIKMTQKNKALKQVYGSPLYGIKTGLNEAFVIDGATRANILAKDPKSGELLKPFLEGKDLKKWRAEGRDLYLILIPKGWTRKEMCKSNAAGRDGNLSEATAQNWMQSHYPAIYHWLEPFAEKAKKRGDKGEFWWELRACIYYNAFENHKIGYVDISDKPNFSLDVSGSYFANTGYFIPQADWFLVGLLNSKLMWSIITSMSPSIRGGFYRMFSQYIELLPIPDVDDALRLGIVSLSETCQKAAETRYKLQKDFCDTLLSEKAIKLSTALQQWWKLDFTAFCTHYKKCFKQELPLKQRAEWKEMLENSRDKIQQLDIEIARCEHEINAAVYKLFNLTQEEIALIENNA